MKQISLLCLLLMSLPQRSQIAFSEKSYIITAGYGFNNLYKYLLKKELKNADDHIKDKYSYLGNDVTFLKGTIEPVFLKCEYGFKDRFSLGLSLGYFTAGVRKAHGSESVYNHGNSRNVYVQVITSKVNSFSAGARLNYHFTPNKRNDSYIGLTAGYTSAAIKTVYATNDPDIVMPAATTHYLFLPVYLAATFGIRHYVTKNTGLYIELGFDKWTFFQTGLVFKFVK